VAKLLIWIQNISVTCLLAVAPTISVRFASLVKGNEQMRGSLFTRDFLLVGIRETEAWTALSEQVLDNFIASLRGIFDDFELSGSPNEATTESEVIFKVLAALGWTDYLPQQTASERRADIPDALLFASADQKRLASKQPKPIDRYQFGLAILENKAWQMPLDRVGSRESSGVPSNQILRYLTVAEVQSDRRIKWGFLTNGRHWRLYYQLARSRSEEFLEFDIPELLGLKGFTDLLTPQADERRLQLKALFLLFGRGSFLPSAISGRCFLETSLEEGKLWEARVAKEPVPACIQRHLSEAAKRACRVRSQSAAAQGCVLSCRGEGRQSDFALPSAVCPLR
jgi:hypothetical protein